LMVAVPSSPEPETNDEGAADAARSLLEKRQQVKQASGAGDVAGAAAARESERLQREKEAAERASQEQERIRREGAAAAAAAAEAERARLEHERIA
jgi:hypothetical protein